MTHVRPFQLQQQKIEWKTFICKKRMEHTDGGGEQWGEGAQTPHCSATGSQAAREAFSVRLQNFSVRLNTITSFSGKHTDGPSWILTTKGDLMVLLIFLQFHCQQKFPKIVTKISSRAPMKLMSQVKY